jgi:hypothetical protein
MQYPIYLFFGITGKSKQKPTEEGGGKQRWVDQEENAAFQKTWPRKIGVPFAA